MTCRRPAWCRSRPAPSVTLPSRPARRTRLQWAGPELVDGRTVHFPINALVPKSAALPLEGGSEVVLNALE